MGREGWHSTPHWGAGLAPLGGETRRRARVGGGGVLTVRNRGMDGGLFLLAKALWVRRRPPYQGRPCASASCPGRVSRGSEGGGCGGCARKGESPARGCAQRPPGNSSAPSRPPPRPGLPVAGPEAGHAGEVLLRLPPQAFQAGNQRGRLGFPLPAERGRQRHWHCMASLRR